MPNRSGKYKGINRKMLMVQFSLNKAEGTSNKSFFFSKEKGENFFYVPIEHVIQQAFIGIFRINSWGRRKHFLPFLNMACRKMTPKYFLLRHFWNIYDYKAANKTYSLRSGTFLVVEERRLITDIYVYWMMILWVKIPFSSS